MLESNPKLIENLIFFCILVIATNVLSKLRSKKEDFFGNSQK